MGCAPDDAMGCDAMEWEEVAVGIGGQVQARTKVEGPGYWRWRVIISYW